MDCPEIRMLALLQQPGVGEADERRVVERHLAGCSACAAWWASEQRLDVRLRRAVGQVKVPSDLKAKVLRSLAAQPRPWPWRSTLAGVASLLLVVLSLFWLFRPAPTLTYEDIASILGSKLSQRDTLSEWLAARGFHVDPPAELNLDAVRQVEVVEFRGERVPMLFLHQPNPSGPATVAHAYLLSDNQFRVDEDADSLPPLGVQNVEILHGPNTICVILYTGNLQRIVSKSAN